MKYQRSTRTERVVSKSARVDLEGVREFLTLAATLYFTLLISAVIAAFAGAVIVYVCISRDFDLLKTLAESPYVYALAVALLGASRFYRRK